MQNVFVYGTLKKGYGNNILLGHSPCIHKQVRTLNPSFVMGCTGGFPVVRKTSGQFFKIEGEMYSVNDETMKRLDRLEGYPSMYTREQILLDSGDTAWIYLYRDERFNYFRDFPTVYKSTDNSAQIWRSEY